MDNSSINNTQFDRNSLLERWRDVTKQVNSATQESFNSKGVTLLAVSKTKPATMVAELLNAGQYHFGENYLQEALPKIIKVPTIIQNDQLNNSIIWHYIGHIQRNKTRDIAGHFHWVHTIEREIIAKRLNDQRPDNLPPLNVLIQVNIDSEDSKSGCLPDEVENLVTQIKSYQRLTLRGLMIIPSKVESGANISAFKRIKTLFDNVGINHPEIKTWDTLSMGMSADLEDAIREGATMVRVGSAIFGSRD